MNRFNWLHLTDLHYKEQNHLWPTIRQALFDDLTKSIQLCGPYNLVLFTGDLTQSGTKEQFSALNEEVIFPLWECLERSSGHKPELVAIPGNHDLTRPDLKRKPAALRQLLRTGGFREIEEEFWADPDCEYRRLVSDAFSNYSQWWSDCIFKPKQLISGYLPGDFSVVLSPNNGFNIGIVGLNSTFLQLSEGDFVGRLAVDPRQLHKICGADLPAWASKNAANILVTHQGSDWWDRTSQDVCYAEINQAGQFCMHIFGHMHKHEGRNISTFGGPVLRRWQGNSLFSSEKIDDRGVVARRHGYSFGALIADDKAVGMRLWPRSAIMDIGGWRFERDSSAARLEESDGGTRQEIIGPSCGPNGKIVEAAKRPLARQGGPRFADDASFSKYCSAVAENHSHIRFVEVPYLKDVSPVELDNLYIEPRLSNQEIHPDTPLSSWPSCIEACEALEGNQALVVLGDPGSGKSTLISCLSWHLSRSGIIGNHWCGKFGDMLPLPIVLRELSLKADLTWEHLLDAFLVHRIGKHLPSKKALEKILAEGRAIVMFDGLDEIGNLTVRQKLRDAIHSGMTLYPKVRWILTSRIVGYDQVPYHVKVERLSVAQSADSEVVGVGKKRKMRTKMADVLYLAPFSDEQITAFSRSWYRQHEKEQALVEASARDFVQGIRENVGTQRLARLPYLLTLMALIHQKNVSLPHGRTELYDRIATAYLEQIDVRRKLDRLPYSLSQKKRWLAEVAFQMQIRRARVGSAASRNQILATRTQVESWLRKAMRQSGGKQTKQEAEVLLNYFAERSGLLLPRAEGRFAFMHLSLQEYFAACFLEPELTAYRFTLGKRKKVVSDVQLQAWINISAWAETFVLLFEMISDKSVEDTDGFLDHLFRPKSGKLSRQDAASAISLLAELATDPFVNMSAESRRRMRQICWRWVFRNGPASRSIHQGVNKIVRSLVRESDGDLGRAWKAASLGIQEIKKVEVLDLSGCATLVDLTPLAPMRSLRFLSLGNCAALSDISPVRKLNLFTLNIEGCEKIASIEALGGMLSLRSLFISHPLDLSPLCLCENLRDLHLHFRDVSEVDLVPVAGLTKLEHICTSALAEEFKKLPSLNNIRSIGLRELVSGGGGFRMKAQRKGSRPSQRGQ